MGGVVVKQIALMRHAQAKVAWGPDDFDRELSAEGHVQAKFAGDWFVKNFQPSVVLCSSALRTRQTYMWISERLGAQAPTAKLEQRLYNASEKDIVSLIAGLSDTADKVLVVAHYPGIQRSSIALSGRRSDEGSLAQACRSFEPASVALIEHSLSWQELEAFYLKGVIHGGVQWQMPKMTDYISGSDFMEEWAKCARAKRGNDG